MYKIKAWLSPLLKFVTHHNGMGLYSSTKNMHVNKVLNQHISQK